MSADHSCPNCDVAFVALDDLDPELREELLDDPVRAPQPGAHRRERHLVCPECTLELHGNGLPFAVTERRCPGCAVEMTPFADLDADLRQDLEGESRRLRQSLAHRWEVHHVCPECTLEIHGCGQPYVVTEGSRVEVEAAAPADD